MAILWLFTARYKYPHRRRRCRPPLYLSPNKPTQPPISQPNNIRVEIQDQPRVAPGCVRRNPAYRPLGQPTQIMFRDAAPNVLRKQVNDRRFPRAKPRLLHRRFAVEKIRDGSFVIDVHVLAEVIGGGGTTIELDHHKLAGLAVLNPVEPAKSVEPSKLAHLDGVIFQARIAEKFLHARGAE